MIFKGGVEVDEVAVLGVADAKDGVLIYQCGQNGVKELVVYADGGVGVTLKEGSKYIRGLPVMVTQFAKKK